MSRPRPVPLLLLLLSACWLGCSGSAPSTPMPGAEASLPANPTVSQAEGTPVEGPPTAVAQPNEKPADLQVPEAGGQIASTAPVPDERKQEGSVEANQTPPSDQLAQGPTDDAITQPPYEAAQEVFDDLCQAQLDHDWVEVFQTHLPGYDQETAARFAIDGTNTLTSKRSPAETEKYYLEQRELLKKHNIEGYDTDNPATYPKLKNISNPQACYVDAMEFRAKHDMLEFKEKWEALKQSKMKRDKGNAVFGAHFYNPYRDELISVGVALIFQDGKWGISITKSYEEEVRLDRLRDSQVAAYRAVSVLKSPVSTMQLKLKFQAGGKDITSFGVSPEGYKLVVSMAHEEIFSWWLNHDRKMAETLIPDWEKNPPKRTTVAFSPDARLIAVGSNERLLLVESDATYWVKDLPPLKPQKHPIQTLTWIGNDHLLVGAGTDSKGTYELVSIRTGKSLATKDAGNSKSLRTAISADGQLLALGVNQSVELYQLDEEPSLDSPLGKPLPLSGVAGQRLGALAISRDAEHIAVAYGAKIYQFQRDGDEFALQFEFDMPGGAEFLDFTADGKRLIASGSSIQVLNTNDGKVVTSQAHPGGIAALPIDAKSLVTKGEKPGEVYVWELGTTDRPLTDLARADEPPVAGKGAVPDPDLQGEWHCISSTTGYETNFYEQDAKVTIEGSKMHRIPLEGNPSDIMLVTNPNALPKTIDFEWVQGGAFNRLIGIYKITGDRLEICIRPLRADQSECEQQRPKDFWTDLKMLILTRKVPQPVKIDVKKIAPKFSTPQEAFETHRQAMLHHDWATAYQSYLPAYQIPYLAQQIAWSRFAGFDRPYKLTHEYYRLHDAMLKKYGVEKFMSTKPDHMEKLRALIDPQGFFIEVMELQAKYRLLKEPMQWEQMKDARVKANNAEATFYYQVQRPFDREPINRLVVWERQDGVWGIETEKTYHAQEAMQLEGIASLDDLPRVNDDSDCVGSRTWTSANGKFKIEAKLHSVIKQVAILKRDDGKIAKVPVNKLSQEDQDFIAEQAKK